jgi:phosphonate transport system ATP-binding protein
MTMKTLLDVKRISKQYNGDTKALSDVSFSIKEGEFVSIIGPSGAGKSTLLRCINRMIEASSGEVVLNGVNVSALNKFELKKVRRTIGMIFQHYNLVNRLSVIENVLHGRLGYKSTLTGMLGIYSETEKQQAVNMLKLLGLEDQIYKRADQLSGGQKQRVGIARSLVQDPKLMLCDEPIASLDPSAAKIIMDYLRTISDKMGITVLVNLHQVDVALRYSDRIIGVNKGNIVYDGPPKELSSSMIHSIYGSEAGDLIFDLGGKHAAG